MWVIHCTCMEWECIKTISSGWCRGQPVQGEEKAQGQSVGPESRLTGALRDRVKSYGPQPTFLNTMESTVQEPLIAREYPTPYSTDCSASLWKAREATLAALKGKWPLSQLLSLLWQHKSSTDKTDQYGPRFASPCALYFTHTPHVIKRHCLFWFLNTICFHMLTSELILSSSHKNF